MLIKPYRFCCSDKNEWRINLELLEMLSDDSRCFRGIYIYGNRNCNKKKKRKENVMFENINDKQNKFDKKIKI